MAGSQVKSEGSKKPRISAQQRKIRLQQIIMGIIGMIVILSMILALAMK